MAAAVKVLTERAVERGVSLRRWHNTEWRDAKAHGPCVTKEQRRIG